MELLRYDDIDLSQTVKRSEEDVNNVLDAVSDILKNVRQNKDQALKDYTQKFDKVTIDNLKVTDEEIKEAYDTIDDTLLEALKKAAANIEKFHKKEIPEEWNIEVREGITAGQIVRPINSVGCYIPGGRAAYPSTILMTVIPAKIAGVKKIICCSPPQKDGKIGNAILVAAHLAGADEIYKVGGAQAIGAMAYSTESVPKVEKIVGPGNIFVTAAKKLVFGQVDIEFPAGPSEVLILADKTANAEYIATDILSQAEHDPKASCFFVTDDEKLAEDVSEIVDKKTEDAPRSEIIKEALANSGKIILTENFEDAIYVTNENASLLPLAVYPIHIQKKNIAYIYIPDNIINIIINVQKLPLYPNTFNCSLILSGTLHIQSTLAIDIHTETIITTKLTRYIIYPDISLHTYISHTGTGSVWVR